MTPLDKYREANRANWDERVPGHWASDSYDIEGVKSGRSPLYQIDVDALAEALACFSVLAVTLGEVIAEIDVNPFVAGPAGPLAVDALVVADPTGH